MTETNISGEGKAPFSIWSGLRRKPVEAPEPPVSAEPAAPAEPPRATPQPTPELRFVLATHLVAETPPETSDGSTIDGLPPSRYEHGLWRAGWTDGRLGETPDPQLQLVASQGKLTRSSRTSAGRRKVAETEAEERHKRVLAEERKKQWTDVSAEYDRVVNDRRRNAHAYSRILAIVYLIFGIGIFIADMPLSLKVAPMLGVEVRQEAPGVDDGISAENLGQLLHHIDALWEPAAVAVGIAALTIAFKIVIDKVQKPYRFETRVSKVFAFAMLLVTFATVIYAFYLIGQARAAHAMRNVQVDRRWLFTVLALMFPLVCGYCFSMSRAGFQNLAHFKTISKENEDAWNRYTISNLEAERAAAAVSSARDELAATESDNVEEEFLRNLYLHGYQRGRCVPETVSQEASLYDRCESLLHHWLSRLQQSDHEAAERRT